MKKILAGVGAIAAVAVILPMFAAFEAHVVNVTATIENAMAVQTKAITFGTTFPEEVLNQPLSVALSGSFINEPSQDGVNYVIRQKPKCGLPEPGTTNPVQYSDYAQVTENADGTFSCPDNYVQLPLLCPFLSKHPDNNPAPGNDGSLDAYHGPLTGWNEKTTEEFQVPGILSRVAEDTVDNWMIDLHVPCFKGSCSQDNQVPPAYQEDPTLEHQQFGCDLWIETTAINPTPVGP